MAGRSKYGAIRTNGYHSRKEAARAQVLKLLEKAGEIRDLREQVKYTLIPKSDGERAVTYVCDFEYFQRKGDGWEQITEDVKGYRTAVFVLKRRMMQHFHGITITEV